MKQGDTIGKKLNRLSASFFQKKSPINPLNRDNCLLATHPSDHNAVYVQNITHRTLERLAYKPRKRKGWGLKNFTKGKVDHETYGHSQRHDLAFLVPVPINYGYGCPSGIPRGPDGRCAAVSVRHCGEPLRS